MSNSTNKAALKKIEKTLATIVGVQKIAMVTPEDFLAHVTTELSKATSEPVSKSRARLSLLYKSVLYSQIVLEKNAEDTESASIKVPVFTSDETTLGEQENTLTAPASLAGKGPDSQFSGGLAKMIANLEGSMAELLKMGKAGEDAGEDDDTTKADDYEEDDEEKAKKAAAEKAGKPFPGAAKPFGAKNEDDEEKAKAKKDLAKVKKGGLDDEGWSDDMTEPNKTAKQDTWGND